MKKFPLAFTCCAAGLLIASGTAGTLLGLREKEIREESRAVFYQVASDAVVLNQNSEARGRFLDATLSRLVEERLAEEERIRQEEEARRQREEAERQRLEEERIRQERENERAERARKAEEKRKQAAEEAAREMATIVAEQEKAAAESNYRSTISVNIKRQEAAAEAEHKAYLAEAPEAVVNLPVTAVKQNPELPNGCEITSLQTLLAYKGISVDKTVLADDYLPQFPFYNSTLDGKTVRAGGDPNLYFAGNPRDRTNSYYCFAGPVITAANDVLAEMNSELKAIDMTGTDEDGLTQLLDLGEPVIVWGTLSMGDAFTYAPNAWVIDEDTGEKHIPFLNLHTVVLHGYDFDYFYLADPIRGNVAVRRETFMNAYRQIGMRAIIIR